MFEIFVGVILLVFLEIDYFLVSEMVYYIIDFLGIYFNGLLLKYFSINFFGFWNF